MSETVARELEAVLFVADEPLSSATLAQAVEIDRQEAERLLESLAEDHARRGSGIVLRRVAGGWRLFTNPDAAPAVERFVLSSRHSRLTKAALETLAIVAYKQPVTRHQISAIRGVDSEGVLRALVDRGLLAEVGREEGPGRPVLYGTTSSFLERLGLASIGDLPPLAPLLGDNGEHGPDTELGPRSSSLGEEADDHTGPGEPTDGGAREA
jgi:segregation and condensation protein B